MSDDVIILVGGPDTGKTNYLGRLWESLRSKTGRLTCQSPPDNIKYVEDALTHILAGTFAPRSTKNISESRSDVEIPIRLAGSPPGPTTNLLVPDVSGELWKRAVETSEIPAEWMSDLKRASGAVLFVRVLSELNTVPLDWVTSRKLLRHELMLLKSVDLPTQVRLCELLRFIELSLNPDANGSPPRVAICVTAYDRLDRQMHRAGPSAYLRKEYPLFAGRMADCSRLTLKAFGVSIVGGDLDADAAFREKFLRGDLSKSGYVVVEEGGAAKDVPDISLPIAWLIEGK